MDGPGVDELGVWIAGVQACGESEGDLDEGCGGVWRIHDAEDEEW